MAAPSSAYQGHDAGNAPAPSFLVLRGQKCPWILPFRRLKLKQLELSFVCFNLYDPIVCLSSQPGISPSTFLSIHKVTAPIQLGLFPPFPVGTEWSVTLCFRGHYRLYRVAGMFLLLLGLPAQLYSSNILLRLGGHTQGERPASRMLG